MAFRPAGIEHQLIDVYDARVDLHGATKYPFRDMAVGDYFVVPTTLPSRCMSIRQCARGWAKRRGLDRKFSVRLAPALPGQPPSVALCVRVA